MNAALPAIVAAGLLASAAAGGEIRFADVSAAAGTAMRHRGKHPDAKIAQAIDNFENVYARGYYWNIRDLTFLDANGDGRSDLFMLDAAGKLWSRLWLGDGKGGFAEAHPARLGPASGGAGYWRVLAADFQGRGAQDVILTSHRIGYLMRIPQGRRLRRVPAAPSAAGDFRMFGELTGTVGQTHLLCDFDGDGCVDFATGVPFDRGRPGSEARVMFGTVTDGEIEHDRVSVPVPVGCQAVAADLDADGQADILARGHWRKVRLIRNLGRRRFADATAASGLAGAPGGGPVAVADFNHDGLLDVYCRGAGASRGAGGTGLYLNRGGARFTDATAGSGLVPAGKARSDARFGSASVADFDNDGLMDLLVCDGDVNRLYRNLGGGKFRDVTSPAGLVAAAMPESANAVGDFDDDGRVDLAVVTAARGVGLFRNVSGGANGWVKVKLVGPRGNPEAAGARVTVYSAGGLGQAKALLGYQELIVSTDFRIARPLHFGLGTHRQCDIRVVFPGGKVAEAKAAPAGRTVVISFGAGKGQAK